MKRATEEVDLRTYRQVRREGAHPIWAGKG